MSFLVMLLIGLGFAQAAVGHTEVGLGLLAAAVAVILVKAASPIDND